MKTAIDVPRNLVPHPTLWEILDTNTAATNQLITKISALRYLEVGISLTVCLRNLDCWKLNTETDT
jgi:hypothetical protein